MGKFALIAQPRQKGEACERENPSDAVSESTVLLGIKNKETIAMPS